MREKLKYERNKYNCKSNNKEQENKLNLKLKNVYKIYLFVCLFVCMSKLSYNLYILQTKIKLLYHAINTKNIY